MDKVHRLLAVIFHYSAKPARWIANICLVFILLIVFGFWLGPFSFDTVIKRFLFQMIGIFTVSMLVSLLCVKSSIYFQNFENNSQLKPEDTHKGQQVKRENPFKLTPKQVQNQNAQEKVIDIHSMKNRKK